ncbi:FtsB family cell division protein [Sphingomonas sp. FW199]|uniref:FtsB family cell division protein n=1 Tax=Sphingomonas sp. FW199 TaxID=3400217 RepID=UPI003CF164F8
MSAGGVIRSILWRAVVPSLAIGFMGIFAYNAVLGANGLLNYREYNRQMRVKQAQYAALQQQRQQLANRVRLLKGKADPDLVDELLRKGMGVSREDEIIILLNQN